MDSYIGENPLEGHRFLALLDLFEAGRADEVFRRLDDFLSANESLDKDGELRGRILCNKGLFASLQKQWDKAIDYYRSAAPFLRERWVLISNQTGLARALAGRGEFHSALHVLEEALAMSGAEPYLALGLLWNYVHISENVEMAVPEHYRDLLLASCRSHGIQLPPEIEGSPSLNETILTAHRMIRDSQRKGRCI